MALGPERRISQSEWFQELMADDGAQEQAGLNVSYEYEPYKYMNNLITATVENYYSDAHVCDVRLDLGGRYQNVPILVYGGGINTKMTIIPPADPNDEIKATYTPIEGMRGRRCPLRVGDRVVIGFINGYHDSPMVLGCFYDITKDDSATDLLKKNKNDEDKEIIINGIKITASADGNYEIKSRDDSVIIRVKDGVVELGNAVAFIFNRLVDERITAFLNIHTHVGGTGVPVTLFDSSLYTTPKVKQGE